jgi:predicted DNA-binding transcriptional regulator YafY
MERKRLIVDRFRRLWTLVEFIAAHPGCGRRALADRFALSERQLQADLNVIRLEMGLPLVRRQGYRFQAGAERAPLAFDLADARLLGLALRRAAADGTIPADAARALAAKLASLFPPHLRPLLARTVRLEGDAGAAGAEADVLGTVAAALERGVPVRLRYGGGRNAAALAEPVVEPELVVPYRGCWYLIGHCRQRGRALMFCLDSVVEAALVGAAAPAT